jgi:antirestriction protein ArdC
MSRDIYQEVTNRIVASLEAGTVPWRRPWKMTGGHPVSLSTGKPYRGINILLLMLEGYDDCRWGTYRAVAAAGGQVRKGEKATSIILWKPVSKGEGDNEQRYMLLRSYSVFNAKQADGLPELPVEEEREFTPIELAEQIVDRYVWKEEFGDAPGPPVSYGHNRAAYSPIQDKVEMPDPEQFESDEAYYCTLFHELIHSTGSEKRLKRIEPALFGTDPYAKEELVAEIGASFLSGVAEFEEAGGEQSAAYISGWIKVLTDQPKIIIQAAAQAQRASDLILGTTFEDVSLQGGDSEQIPVHRHHTAVGTLGRATEPSS